MLGVIGGVAMGVPIFQFSLVCREKSERGERSATNERKKRQHNQKRKLISGRKGHQCNRGRSIQ
jgi:hypothetical protein